MIHLAALLAAAAMSSGNRIAAAADEDARRLDSQPRGPGLTWHAYTEHRPLPRPASQQKRRKRARQRGGGR